MPLPSPGGVVSSVTGKLFFMDWMDYVDMVSLVDFVINYLDSSFGFGGA